MCSLPLSLSLSFSLKVSESFIDPSSLAAVKERRWPLALHIVRDFNGKPTYANRVSIRVHSLRSQK